MKKLCIVFPGRRYSCDRSLLYFSSLLLRNKDFEMLYLHYDKPKETESLSSLEENHKEAYDYTINKLSQIDISLYSQIVFISKSLGTVVAGEIREQYKDKNITEIYFTPLRETLPFIKETDLVITGDQDRFLPEAKDIFSHDKNAFVLLGLSHSLENYKQPSESLKILSKILDIITNYLDKNKI